MHGPGAAIPHVGRGGLFPARQRPWLYRPFVGGLCPWLQMPYPRWAARASPWVPHPGSGGEQPKPSGWPAIASLRPTARVSKEADRVPAWSCCRLAGSGCVGGGPRGCRGRRCRTWTSRDSSPATDACWLEAQTPNTKPSRLWPHIIPRRLWSPFSFFSVFLNPLAAFRPRSSEGGAWPRAVPRPCWRRRRQVSPTRLSVRVLSLFCAAQRWYLSLRLGPSCVLVGCRSGGGCEDGCDGWGLACPFVASLPMAPGRTTQSQQCKEGFGSPQWTG
ncbi:hypothetical protein BD289DRAFT_448970 [Coniella lustricola]|uniref:Uncharacterized protein n=1 Tax=Coniella lustricola TaxID=2025994 RepID=A0A2T2ZRM0_9PEZI|nr:hypothetical protein BD289DRAFT_448970 [Coniella lustricola]